MPQSEASQNAWAIKHCKTDGNRALHAPNIFCWPKAQIPSDSHRGLRRPSGGGISASYWLNLRHGQKLAVWCRAESRMRAGSALNVPLGDWWHLLTARPEVFLGPVLGTRLGWFGINLQSCLPSLKGVLTTFILHSRKLPSYPGVDSNGRRSTYNRARR